jgi:hypothetical protein
MDMPPPPSCPPRFSAPPPRSPARTDSDSVVRGTNDDATLSKLCAPALLLMGCPVLAGPLERVPNSLARISHRIDA